MMALAPLVQRSFARIAGIFAGVALLLGAMQVALVLVATSQQEAQSFELMARLAPSFLQRQFGAAFPIFLSFQGLIVFGYFHPVVMLLVSLSAAFVATELVADVEGGQIDLLLSRPLSRHALVTRSLLAVALTPIVLVILMTLASRIGLWLFAPRDVPWPSRRVTAVMGAHLIALAWCFGAFGLALASMAKRRIGAMGPAAIVAISLYLLDLLGGAWRPLARSVVISPFHYYQAPAILSGTAQTGRDLSVLLLMAAGSTAIAYWRFNSRDV